MMTTRAAKQKKRCVACLSYKREDDDSMDCLIKLLEAESREEAILQLLHENLTDREKRDIKAATVIEMPDAGAVAHLAEKIWKELGQQEEEGKGPGGGTGLEKRLRGKLAALIRQELLGRPDEEAIVMAATVLASCDILIQMLLRDLVGPILNGLRHADVKVPW